MSYRLRIMTPSSRVPTWQRNQPCSPHRLLPPPAPHSQWRAHPALRNCKRRSLTTASTRRRSPAERTRCGCSPRRSDLTIARTPPSRLVAQGASSFFGRVDSKRVFELIVNIPRYRTLRIMPPSATICPFRKVDSTRVIGRAKISCRTACG